MKAGDMVKIPDIGPLATVIQPGRNQVKCELEGEQLWIDRRLVEEVESDD